MDGIYMGHCRQRFIFLKYCSEHNEDGGRQEWMPILEVAALIKTNTEY